MCLAYVHVWYDVDQYRRAVAVPLGKGTGHFGAHIMALTMLCNQPLGDSKSLPNGFVTCCEAYLTPTWLRLAQVNSITALNVLCRQWWPCSVIQPSPWPTQAA